MTKAEIQKLWAKAHKKFPTAYVSVEYRIYGFIDSPYWRHEIFILNKESTFYARLEGNSYEELLKALEECNELSDSI